MKLLKIVFFILLSFLFTNLVYSYPNNYQQILIGSRLAGMGGAGVSIGGVGEGAYYNPATIIFTDRDGVSLAVSNYGFYKAYEYNRDKAGDTINKDIKYTSGLLVIPNISSTTWILDKENPNPKYYISFGIFVPSKTDLEGEQTGNDSQFYNHVRLWEVNYIYQAHLTFAMRFHKHIAFGISIVGAYTKLYNNYVLNRLDTGTSDDTTVVEAFNFKTIAFGLNLGLVAMYKRWKFGFTVKIKKMRIYSESNFSRIVPGQIPEVFWNLKVNYTMPIQGDLGVSFEIIPKKLIFAVDLHIYLPEEQEVLNVPPYRVVYNRKTVFNVNAGIEWKINKSWSVRGGFYTDHSATPEITASSADDIGLIRVHRYGFTLGFGFRGKHTNTNISFVYVFGNGKRKIQNIAVPSTFGITDIKVREFAITVGTSYWFDNPKKKKKKKKKFRRQTRPAQRDIESSISE